MDPNTVTTVLVAAATALGTNALSKAEGPAQAIDDIMELVGFGKLTEWANRKRSRRELNTQRYIDEIANEMSFIEPDNFQEPKTSIIGPALEASKYYIEDETLRSMFAKLVASSIDSSKNNVVHESFVEIIKQLSALDAKHLIQILNNQVNPVININLQSVGQPGAIRIFELVYLSQYLTLENHSLISTSLTNLKRLGLINISFMESYTNKDHYNALKNHRLIKSTMRNNNQNNEVQIEEGTLTLTPFGNSFCQVCL